MEKRIITANEAGQRLDKYLSKYLNAAPKSFIYKMLRKKNITLNGGRASGNEKINSGDEIVFYLSTETVEKFRNEQTSRKITDEIPFTVIYEDDHICLMNKPSGVLSQKAREDDVSMIEYFTSYLIRTNAIDESDMESFHPAVCNRLDRNTSGIIIGGKTVTGLQEMSKILQERTAHKYYLCVVDGHMEGTKRIKGYLTKKQSHNKVTITDCESEGASYIETEYRVLKSNGKQTLLEVWLLTGRSHQIRAHLASTGHPIMGDGKYGNPVKNKEWKRLYQLKSQFLHSYMLRLPAIDGELAYLSGREFTAPLPDKLAHILKKEGLMVCLPGIQED